MNFYPNSEMEIPKCDQTIQITVQTNEQYFP